MAIGRRGFSEENAMIGDDTRGTRGCPFASAGRKEQIGLGLHESNWRQARPTHTSPSVVKCHTHDHVVCFHLSRKRSETPLGSLTRSPQLSTGKWDSLAMGSRPTHPTPDSVGLAIFASPTHPSPKRTYHSNIYSLLGVLCTCCISGF